MILIVTATKNSCKIFFSKILYYTISKLFNEVFCTGETVLWCILCLLVWVG